MNADRSEYRWCRHCKLYWKKRGFATHAKACNSDTKLVVEISAPPMPKPKKGDVVVLHPAYSGFLEWLADIWLEKEKRRIMSGEGSPTDAAAEKAAPNRPARRPTRSPAPPPEPDYEVITVEEAVVRFGMTREQIMARFDAMADATVITSDAT